MSYRSSTIDELFFVRWIAGASDDLDAITAAVIARRAEVGRPLVYVSIQDDATKTPDEAFAKHVLSLAPEFVDHLERLYLVVAVRGLAGNLHKKMIRAGLVAARAVDPERAAKVTLVDSMAQLFDCAGVAADRRRTIERQLAAARLLPGSN